MPASIADGCYDMGMVRLVVPILAQASDHSTHPLQGRGHVPIIPQVGRAPYVAAANLGLIYIRPSA